MQNATPTKWIDGRGKSHEISSMETAYIRNCLSRLKSSPVTEERTAYIEAFETELADRKSLKNRLAVIAGELK